MSHIVHTLLFEHLSTSKIKDNPVLKTDHYKTAVYSDRMEMDIHFYIDILNWVQKISKQYSTLLRDLMPLPISRSLLWCLVFFFFVHC